MLDFRSDLKWAARGLGETGVVSRTTTLAVRRIDHGHNPERRHRTSSSNSRRVSAIAVSS
jgi:hypothetical protein